MDKIIPENANFFEKMTACFGDLSKFSQQIRQIARIAQLDLKGFEIDHLAVRVNHNETATRWWRLLLENAALLKESEVNGRPIGLFRLHQAILCCGQYVDVIELPFPKGKIYPVEGWEHAEIVYPMLAGETVGQWIERTLVQFKLAENTALTLKISQPHVAGERLPNPSIAISLADRTYQNFCCLKLHPYGIKDIICSENNL